MSDTSPAPITLIGLTKDPDPSGADDLAFALDIDRGTWITVPANLIQSVETLGSVEHGGEALYRVRVRLKPAETPEGRVLGSVAASYERALMSLVSKVSPAISASATLRASDACLDCLESCRLIPVTEDDPFAQIICMLECVDCPG
jgi:hypothetical protein